MESTTVFILATPPSNPPSVGTMSGSWASLKYRIFTASSCADRAVQAAIHVRIRTMYFLMLLLKNDYPTPPSLRRRGIMKVCV